MVDNLFDLAAKQQASQSSSSRSLGNDFTAEPAFLKTLDPESAYSLTELQQQYESYKKALELEGEEGEDEDEDDDAERDYSECSYKQGYVKQELYGCKTCAADGGICVCCFNNCHEGHDLFPVDPKRHFRCDCPTSTFSTPCALSTPTNQIATIFAGSSKLPPNEENKYGPNFKNLFCWCLKEYGEESVAAETMIQCIVCEDWYHENHLNIKQPSRVALPANVNPADPSGPGVLLREDEYAALVCENCVLTKAHAPLSEYFGTPRFVGLVKGEDEKWDRVGFVDGAQDEESDDEAPAAVPEVVPASEDAAAGSAAEGEESTNPAGPFKRPLEDSSSPSRLLKKLRPSTTCTRPAASQDGRATGLLEQRRHAKKGQLGWGEGRCDMFLQKGWNRSLCHCEVHGPLLENLPFLLTCREPLWQPPLLPLTTSTDNNPLTEDRLLPTLLSTFGHSRTMDAISGLEDMAKSLGEHVERLGPGTVLGRKEIEEFMEAWKDKREKERAGGQQ